MFVFSIQNNSVCYKTPKWWIFSADIAEKTLSTSALGLFTMVGLIHYGRRISFKIVQQNVLQQ